MEVMNNLKKQTSDINILEHYNNFFWFRIGKNEKSIGFYFGLMEWMKKEIKFSEYAVCQTSLEQIFNNFATEQREEGFEKWKSTIKWVEE